MTHLLPTKFYFPPTPAVFVARPRLLDRLDDALTHRLTLVSAPAGAGKTTLVSAWAQSARKQGKTFGWLSLDEGDNTPERFLDYLLACLEEGGLPADVGASAAAPDMADLIRGLVALRRQAILILDDYHHIQHPPIHTALQYLIDHAPPSFHLLLLTRSDPPLELARLRVAGQLAEIRMEHLRFSTAEAGAFLEKSAGVHLPEADISALNTRAEGWIAGLQMASISLRGASDPQAFVSAFTGSHRYVFDYLIEQVLNRQTPAVREFLLKTSVLERFTAPLCDAVAGTNGAASALLDAMERANLFLTPLDNERGWYRYHHLFAELLKLMLEQSHPGLATGLHRLASQWFRAQGMLTEALHHSLVAEDMELAAQIVSENVLALVEHAEIVPILARIASIPRDQRAARPWLDVAYAWGLAYNGQNPQAAIALTQAEQHFAGPPDPAHDKLLGHIAAVRAYIAWTNGEQLEAESFARKADGLLPPDELAIRALNLTTLGNALIQLSGDTRSVDVLEEALALARQVGQLHVIMTAASGLGFAYAILGRFRRAREVCEQAVAIADEYQRQNGRPLTAASCAYAMLARVCVEAGEFEKALQIARKGFALSELWGQVDTIMICHFYLTQALIFTRQAESAQEILRSARKIAQKASPWHLANVEESELEAYLDMDPQDSAEIQREAARMTAVGRQWVSFSPVRVLLKLNRPAEALSLLEQVWVNAGPAPAYRHVRLYALQALAYYQNKEYSKAYSTLEQAIQLAEPENRVAAFVREGAAMERLFRSARGKISAPDFIRRVLAAFESYRQNKVEAAPPTEALIEPLSEREMEVLRHLNSYLSTPEIADLLVVSANTVRTHIKNIYGKLGVHGRSGAVKRAMQLGLLA